MNNSTLTCTYCNSQITRKISVSDLNKSKTKNLFCSRSCSCSFNNKLDPRRKLEGNCKSCDCPISKSRKFCKYCLPVARGKRILDNTSLANITGTIYQKHSTIRKHARKKFLKIHSQGFCQSCGYSKHIEICHKKPIRDWCVTSLLSEVNSIDNLIALCPNCHWEFDHGLLTL